MNYRHAYHAGNFADVLKHAVLALVIDRLKQKPTPFRVIDTHAGVGVYDLGGEAAQKTGEWRDGIGRLLGPGAAAIPAEVAPMLAPYLDAVKAFNPSGALTTYPGSPAIVRHLLRTSDRLIVNELHPDDHAVLARHFARDRQTKVLSLDGWVALKATLPPKERRGVVLIDPPFEEAGEFERLEVGLVEAVRRFATGVYLLWYPIKDEKPISRFHRRLTALGLPKLMSMDLLIRAPRNPEELNGCGLILLNTPYPVADWLAAVGRTLAAVLARGPGAKCNLQWLGPDT
jgi:23S rRNA (adenine2030-N6)-methyltransferase